MSTIDTIESSCQSNEASERYRGASSAIAQMFNWIGSALAKRRSRTHLSELTDDQLRDIGKTRSEARREFLRSFWD